MSEPVRWLTYRQAARRVGRSVRTIRRWVKAGLPAGWDQDDRRIIREDLLVAELGRRLARDPVHQLRVRAAVNDKDLEGWS